MQWHGQIVVVAEVINVPKSRRADAYNDIAHASTTVWVGLASNVEEAVNEVEHRAVLCVEHLDDIIVSLVILLVAPRRIDEHLPLMVEILGLH